MKGFALAFTVVIFVVGGITYYDYTKFCDCVQELEKAVASYNDKAQKEIIGGASAEAERRRHLAWKAQGEPKADWLVANLQGDFPESLGQMHDAGILMGMFDIASPNEYWSIGKIRDAFKDETGAERRDFFEEFYTEQLETYNAYRVAEISLLNDETLIFRNKPDPWERSYSSLTGWSSGTLNEQCKTDNVILKLCGMEDHF